MADLGASYGSVPITERVDVPNALAAQYQNQQRQFQAQQQQRQQASQNAFAQALPMIGRSAQDNQNALMAVGATGDPAAYEQTASIIQSMDQQQRQKTAERSEALGQLFYTLKAQYKDPMVRKAVALSQAPALAAHGVTPDQLQSGDYSDQGLELGISHTLSLKDQIAQSNADRTAKLADDKFHYEQKNDKANRDVTIRGQDMTDKRAKEMAGLVAGGGLPDFGDPTTQSHVKNILSGNETMAQVPAALRNKVSLALQDAGGASPMAAQRLTLASSRITAPYTNMAAYKLTADGLPYLQRIDAASKHPGSVSDQDLLDSLTKLNTGGNAVTDAQVSLITHGKSLSDWANTVGQKLQNGGVLSDNQRKQIKDIASDIFSNYRKGYQPVFEDAKRKLTEAGIPEQYWTIPDLNKLNAGQADILAHKPQATNGKPGSDPATDALLKKYGVQ